jgi:hypothetical protein
VMVASRVMTNLLDRYDELRAKASADPQRLRRLLRGQARVVLALDGLQPNVGHEVRWVLWDCLSAEMVLARRLLAATIEDLSALLREARNVLPIPIPSVVSDGQDTIRKALSSRSRACRISCVSFVPCASRHWPIEESDRHAIQELNTRGWGVRPIKRAVRLWRRQG